MSTVSAVSKISTAVLPRTRCLNCGVADWSEPAQLTFDELHQIDKQVTHFRRIRCNEFVLRSGAPLRSLNIIRSGFLKTCMTDCRGNVQIIGFSIRGDFVGMDAISTGVHQCDVIALEDTYVCGIAFEKLERLLNNMPALQRLFTISMGAEIGRHHGTMFMLGSTFADKRVAMFLINLSKRFAALGFSAVNFQLPMRRQELSDHLGLKMETVSRTLSRLQETGIIAIDKKNIEINIERLLQIIRR